MKQIENNQKDDPFLLTILIIILNINIINISIKDKDSPIGSKINDPTSYYKQETHYNLYIIYNLN